MGRNYFTLLLLLLFFCTWGAANAQETKGTEEPGRRYLSLEGSERLEALVELVREFRKNRPDKSILYGKEALKLAEELKDKPQQAELKWLLGEVHFRSGDFPAALKYLKEALPGFSGAGGAKKRAEILYLIGAVNYRFGNYSKVQEYFLRSLKISEEHSFPAHRASTLNGLGLLNKQLRDYDQALKYYHKALEIGKRVGKRETFSIYYNNIGVVYERLNRPDESIKYYRKALEISMEFNDLEGVASAYGNLGLMYNRQGQYARALAFTKKAMDVSKKMNDRYGIANAFQEMARSQRKMGRSKEALDNLNKALEMAKEMKSKELQAFCTHQLALIYTGMGDHRRADRYLTQYTTLRDEVFSLRSSRQAAELKTLYQTEKMEKEIELLKQRHIIDDLELSKQKTFKNLFLVVVFLLFAFVLLLVSRFRVKQRAHREVSAANKELKEALGKLETAGEEIETLTGLIPICSHCKRVRDDAGYWLQVEVYLQKHSEADFSHHVCPHCAEELGKK